MCVQGPLSTEFSESITITETSVLNDFALNHCENCSIQQLCTCLILARAETVMGIVFLFQLL